MRLVVEFLVPSASLVYLYVPLHSSEYPQVPEKNNTMDQLESFSFWVDQARALMDLGFSQGNIQDVHAYTFRLEFE